MSGPDNLRDCVSVPAPVNLAGHLTTAFWSIQEGQGCGQRSHPDFWALPGQGFRLHLLEARYANPKSSILWALLLPEPIETKWGHT